MIGGNFFVICMFCFSFKDKEFKKKAHFYAQLSPVREEEEEEAAGELIPATASTATAIVRVNAAVCCRC